MTEEQILLSQLEKYVLTVEEADSSARDTFALIATPPPSDSSSTARSRCAIAGRRLRRLRVRAPEAKMEAALTESTWQSVRERLESERRRINDEIEHYPPPIPRCDAHHADTRNGA